MDVPTILGELDDHGFAVIQSARKVNFINEVVGDIFARAEWPFAQTRTTVVWTPPQTNGVTFADLLRVISVYDTTDHASLKLISAKEFDATYADSDTAAGIPLCVYPVGFSLFLWPLPTATTTLKVNYVSRAPVLTSVSTEAAILIPPQFHKAIVDGVLYKLYNLNEEQQNAAHFKADYEEMVDRMMQQLIFKPQGIPVDPPIVPGK